MVRQPQFGGGTQELIEKMNQRPTALSPENLKPVDALRLRLQQIANDDSWSLHWGLYTGDDVHRLAQLAYFKRLRAMFLDGANNKLGSGLASAGTPSSDSLFDRGESARNSDGQVVSGRSHPGQSRDGACGRGLASEPGPGIRIVGTGTVGILEYYTAQLAADGPVPVTLTRNDTAVASAQTVLANDGGMEPQLNSILAEVAKQVPPFKLADRVPDYAKVLAGPAQIPGEFTKRGAEIASGIIEAGNWGSAANRA